MVCVCKDLNVFFDFFVNIIFDKELDFKIGNGLFCKFWVSFLLLILVFDGLGFLFNVWFC